MRHFLLIINLSILILPAATVTCQDLEQSELAGLSYRELISRYDQYAYDTLQAREIARVYIDKARLDGDSTLMARGYQRLAFVAPLHDAVRYLDTTIALSAGSEHPNFPASGYLFKSLYLYKLEQYERSLENALLGYRHAKEKENVEQQLTALHQINGVNELYGDYQTALKTGFQTRDLLFEHRDLPGFLQYYLSSLETIGKCYVRINKPDSALYYFRKGLETALAENDSISYYAFVSQSGTALNARGDYRQGLDSLLKADVIRSEYNNSYLPGFYYHVGTAYYNLGDQERAMTYFHKIDSIYNQRAVLYPELPKVYDKMIAYYQQKGDREQQLELLKKQVLALRLMDEKRVFIKEKTNEDYVIPSLVAAKEEQIRDLEERNETSEILIWASLGLLAFSLGFLAFYIRRQQIFRRRFQKLMQQDIGDTDGTSAEGLDQLGIATEIVHDVLERIERFEAKKGYLDRSLTLNRLAKKLETNSTYLSKIINVKKGKNFSRYISDLRVEFAVRELKENSTFRKYTIKAIAKDCGFKSAESFSKSFYRRHGIYPSYYIKQLKDA